MNTIFIFFQHLIPQHFLSRVTGRLADLRQPRWFKNWLIHRFIEHFDVDMSEAEPCEPSSYASFNDFFTRPLVAGARPLANAAIISPADGRISQLGSIDAGLMVQAKGYGFTVEDLLGGDRDRAEQFNGGNYATIYLSPRDYHRVHMPLDGRLAATTYIPGRLFSVNEATACGVDRLFARNERLVCYFDTEIGPVAIVLVGAMVVAGIETVWDGQVAPPPRQPLGKNYLQTPDPVELDRGGEMGRFRLGSTVIILLPPGAVRWDNRLIAGTAVKLGEAMVERESPI